MNSMISREQYVKEVNLDYTKSCNKDDYTINLPFIKNFDRLSFHPKVTFIIGENGSGKSTLLEAIAVKLGFNPEGGSSNFNFSTRKSHSRLHNFISIKRGNIKPKDEYFLRAESFYNVATAIEELDREAEECGGYGKPIISFFGGKSLHEQSHGESFFTLLNKRFVGNGLYLLDEPEAALSPSRQMSMITRMHDLCSLNSQFVIATHSPILLAYPNSIIYQVSDVGIKSVNYENTEHYQITKSFLNKHEQMMSILIDDQ
ncbi:MAG: AAA family ATPase [bacterium]